MTVNLQFHIAWPVIVPLALLVWLPVCVAIGNLLQREWWMNVLVISAFVFVLSIPFALSSLFWA